MTGILRSPTPTPVLATPRARTLPSQLRPGASQSTQQPPTPLTLTLKTQETHWSRKFSHAPTGNLGAFSFFLPSISFSCIDFDAHVSGSLKYRLNPNTSQRQMVPRDNFLPQATPDLGHSGDCTEATGHLSFVSLREVSAPLWLLSKHDEFSAESEGAAISPEKQAGQPRLSKLRGKEEAADPPSGCVLGARTQVVCCRSSLRACVLLWLGSPDHRGLLWALGQSLCPAKDRIPKQAPSALCPSPLSGYSLHQLPLLHAQSPLPE